MVIKKFNPNSRPRGKTKQIGANSPYLDLSRRLDKKLELYETVSTYDSTISSTLNLIAESLVSSLGEIEHVDEDAQEFCRNEISFLQSEYQIDVYQEIKQIVKSALWAGFAISEVLYERRDEQLNLKGFAHYHPRTIVLRTNENGQLTEGEPSVDPGFSSGIWQKSLTNSQLRSSEYKHGEVKLSMWKTVLLTYDKKFNNYYGTSIIEGCYRWHIIKETLLDMFLLAQDQHGNPLTVMYVPNTKSGEYEIDPETGEQKALTVMNSIERQLNNVSSQEGNTILFPFTDPDMKPDVRVISNNSNVAQGYLDSIKFCDQQIIKSMMVPLSLIDTTGTTNSEQAERDMEMFNRIIESLYKTFVVPFINKSFGRLIKENFSSDVSKHMPSMQLRNIMRPEDRVSMMQFIRGLTELTYLNPSNEVDRSMVRSWVGAVEREWDSDDATFFRKFLLQEDQESSSKKQSTNATPQNRGSRSPTRNRKNEGNKKPGGKKGRPVGKASPNVRDKNKRSNNNK